MKGENILNENFLILSINKSQNTPIMVGGTSTLTLSILNTSASVRLYNLNISLILPNGMDLYSSVVSYTSKNTSSDGSVSYYWTNIKDLAPLEVNYSFDITVKCNTKFKDNTIIPFGYLFSGVLVQCQMDTMPRGNYDMGNEQKTLQNTSLTFKTIKYYGSITLPSKIVKGAGTSPLFNDYTKSYTATFKVYNNAISTSDVQLSILLDDGIRYLGNLTVSGTDSSQVVTPAITTVIINNKLYTSLFFGTIHLSLNSATTLNFKYAVWNRYNENIGDLITHGTKLGMSLNLIALDDSYKIASAFTALDIMISASVNKTSVDVGDSVLFYGTYEVGQYYTINNIVIDYLLPDGINYISSSISANSVVTNVTIKGTNAKHIIPLAVKNYRHVFTINTIVASNYSYKVNRQDNTNLPVVSFDSFIARVNLQGSILEIPLDVIDSSLTSCSIKIASIKKQLLNIYYRDGTLKMLTCAAPNDLVEYKLTYDASAIKATQKQIYMEDFFPLSANPIDNLSYTFAGYNTGIITPKLIDPHGVDFFYGDMPNNAVSTITFKAPIQSLGSTTANNNLLKFKGINTDGFSYSGRDQVQIKIGTPNLTLIKIVLGPGPGPNKSAIRAGETYTYTVVIANTNTLLTETDAFDFTVVDNLSSWYDVNISSIQITGSGDFQNAVYNGSTIQFHIDRLAPGNAITLTYSVVINPLLPPGLTITTTATNTNPFSQAYDQLLPNYQYTNLNKTASATISSANITVVKYVFNQSLYKVGSLVSYKIVVTIPVGTICYEAYLKDVLPSGYQTYFGPSSRNGTVVIPSISSNNVTFSKDDVIDARTATLVFEFLITAKITNAVKVLNTTTSTQSNSCVFYYKQKQSFGSYNTITKSVAITVNHPNILLSLSEMDKTTSIIYTQNATITNQSLLDLTLYFQNNSSINLVNATIEIPIDNNFYFIGVKNAVQCTASYDSKNKKLLVQVQMLTSLAFGYVVFSLGTLSNLKSGTTFTTTATAISYYNDISTKQYGGETSNTIITVLPVATSLLPNPLDRVDDYTSYRYTLPGRSMSIINFFQNTGGGYDNYTVTIQKVGLPYTLYINDVLITTVTPNTLYQDSPDIMKNVPAQGVRTFRLDVRLPSDTPAGTRYDFIVTACSITSPFPQKTIVNIDPC